MYCRNCGHAIVAGHDTCPQCGCRGGNDYCQECGAPTAGSKHLCMRCGAELEITLADGSHPVGTFGEAVKMGFKRYATFRGRANRAEYWLWILFVVIITSFVVVGWIALPVIIIPTMSITARRLHDVGKSGWLQLLFLIPVVGLYPLFLLMRSGQKGDNRFGFNPEC